MNRSLACSLLLAATAAFACQSGGSSNSTQASAPTAAQHVDVKNVGILIFDGLFITEFAAPFDVYKHVGDRVNVFTVGRTRAPIKTYEGVELHPDYGFADAPTIDVLVVPSGLQSTSTDLED